MRTNKECNRCDHWQCIADRRLVRHRDEDKFLGRPVCVIDEHNLVVRMPGESCDEWDDSKQQKLILKLGVETKKQEDARWKILEKKRIASNEEWNEKYQLLIRG